VLGSWVFRRDVPEEIYQLSVFGFQFSVKDKKLKTEN